MTTNHHFESDPTDIDYDDFLDDMAADVLTTYYKQSDLAALSNNCTAHTSVGLLASREAQALPF